MANGIGQIIFGAAQRYGVDPNALSTIAHLESRGNPMAKNPNSSAGGLFQFIDSTAKQYGLQDKFDPAQSADAGARLLRDNQASLSKALGRQPTAGELYLAHQQGAGGATKLLSNPNARAVDIVGADAVRLNGGNENMTAQEFANLWINKANRIAGQAEPILSSQGRPQMADQQQQPQGLLGGTKLGEFLTPERRDRLILALQGMTLNPNQGLQQLALGNIQQRQQQQGQQQQASRTIAFLKAKGRDDLAAAVESGGLSAKDATQIALTPATAENVVVNNRLVNRQTGDIVADFSASETGDDVPSAIRSLQLRAEAGGLKPGSPEYQEFMLRGGASQGIALQVGPDGTVSFAQGGAQLKPLTETQSSSATYAVRAEGALPILDQNDKALTSRAQRAAELDPTGLARELQTPEFQAAKQAGDEFLQAILRKDTGAAITQSEQDLYGKTYLPQPGDSEEQIAQKRQSRRRALEALKAGMSADAILAQERALVRSGDTKPDETESPATDVPLTPEQRQLLEFMTPEERALFE